MGTFDGTEAIKDLTNLIIGILIEKLGINASKLADKKDEKLFLEGIEILIDDYISNHSYSIVNTNEFYIFVKHYNPIGKMVLQIKGQETREPKDKLIESIIIGFSEYLSKNSTRVLITKNEIKDLLNLVYDNIDSYYANKLPPDLRYMLGKIDSFRVKESQEGESISRACFSQNNPDYNTINDNTDLYFSLVNHALSGNVGAVYHSAKALPNCYLKDAVCLLCKALSSDDDISQDFVSIQNHLSDDVYWDVVTKLAYIQLIKNKKDFFLLINRRNEKLYNISQQIYEGDYSYFYDIKVKRTGPIVLRLLNRKSTEASIDWLGKRICLIDKDFGMNSYDYSKSELENSTNILDMILLFNYAMKDRSAYSESYLDNLYKKMSLIKPLINDLSLSFQCMFYQIYLKTAFEIDPNKCETVYEEMPGEIKVSTLIQSTYEMFNLLIDKSNDDISFIQLCIKNDFHKLLQDYLYQLINRKPDRVIQIFGKFRFLIDKNASFFFCYIAALRIKDKDPAILDLLQEYKNEYCLFIEYWLNYACIDTESNYFDCIFTLWDEGKLELVYPNSINLFIKLLALRDRLEDVIVIVEQLENCAVLSDESMLYYAISLTWNQQELKAIDIYLELYAKGMRDELLLFSYLKATLQNNRIVPDKILESASQSSFALTLTYAALHYESRDKHTIAKDLVERAVLIDTDETEQVYDGCVKILNYSSQTDFHEKVRVEENTFIHLKSKDNNSITYCIYNNDFLPKNYYFRKADSSYHICTDAAVQKKLFRKTKGSTVSIDGKDYFVDAIMPLDFYFYSYCMTKKMELGRARLVLPKDEESIKEAIKEATSIHGDYIDRYNNEDIPFPLFTLFSITRKTYSQFIQSMIKNDRVIFRECSSSESSLASAYVLSYSALISLYMLQVKPEEIPNTSVPESFNIDLTKSFDQIKKETDSTKLQLVNSSVEDLSFLNLDEKEKEQIVLNAYELKEYCSKLNVIDNCSEISFQHDVSFDQDIKDILGICDYDAIAISQKFGHNLVTAELFVGILSHNLCDPVVNTLSLIDYLTRILDKVIDLLCVAKQMFEYKYTFPISYDFLIRLSDEYHRNEHERKKLHNLFLSVINTEIVDERYKSHIASVFEEIFNRINANNPDIFNSEIGLSFLKRYAYLNDFDFAYYFDEQGRLIIKLSENSDD